MQRRRTVLRGLFGAARWVAPWLCVLALSASLAYATDAALTGGHVVPEAPVTIAASTATEVDVDFCAAASSTALYIGTNNWVHIEPRPPQGCTLGSSGDDVKSKPG
jgi:hypothetical protein